MTAAPVDETTPNPRTTAGKAADLAERRAQALSRRQDAVDKQHNIAGGLHHFEVVCG